MRLSRTTSCCDTALTADNGPKFAEITLSTNLGVPPRRRVPISRARGEIDAIVIYYCPLQNDDELWSTITFARHSAHSSVTRRPCVAYDTCHERLAPSACCKNHLDRSNIVTVCHLPNDRPPCRRRSRRPYRTRARRTTTLGRSIRAG